MRDPNIGRLVAGRFRIEALLGKGGMGTVYLAEQLPVRRKVALKLLSRELADDRVLQARFELEAQAASRIKSPHVVVLHDFGRDDDGTLFIAMEVLEGETLRAMLEREGALPAPRAVVIARQIARALEAAHAAGVVHRDLKPDNVMLIVDPEQTAAGGGVKVLDFGIAKMVHGDDDAPSTRLTQKGGYVGTPLYMSPEAIARKTVGPAADLYALGVILYEMLVGTPPFDDPQPVLLMGMHLRVPPLRLREARADLAVSDELEELVAQLLAKEPESRPGSAAEVARVLRRMSSLPSLAPPPPPTPAPSPEAVRATHPTTPTAVGDLAALPERRRRWIAPVAGSVALLATAVVIAIISASGSEVTPTPGSSRPAVPSASPLPSPDEPPPAVADEREPDDATVATVSPSATALDAGTRVRSGSRGPRSGGPGTKRPPVPPVVPVASPAAATGPPQLVDMHGRPVPPSR